MSIYKYTSTHIYNSENKKINKLKYIFEDNLLWFSNPLKLNDPFELKPHIKEFVVDEKDMILNIGANLINASEQAHQSHYASVTDILNNTGILSLSINKEHFAMWAHYADNHKGIVLELDKEHSFFTSLKLPSYAILLHNLEKVDYESDRESINSNEYFRKKTFLTKSKNWEYEEEYRMSVYVETNNKYLDGIDIIFPNDLIKAIYIGCKANKETIDYIVNLKKNKKWSHLKIYKMSIDEKEYKLNETLV